MLFIDTSADEEIENPYYIQKLSGVKLSDMSLDHFWLTKSAEKVRCWYMHKANFDDKDSRDLRVSLLRLNAFRESLEALIGALTQKRIAPAPRSEPSERLQYYINHVADRCFEVPRNFAESNVLNLAHQTENACLPGERYALIEKLRYEVDIRRQVLEKASKNFELRERLQQSGAPFFQDVIIGQEVIMGNKFEAGQAGAMGPDAHAHDMTFNQIWNQTRDSIDLPTLALQLNSLRSEMAKTATSAEELAEVGAVASAELHAGKGEGGAALAALSKTGKWAVSVAEQIGVGVAAAAISTACGF